MFSAILETKSAKFNGYNAYTSCQLQTPEGRPKSLSCWHIYMFTVASVGSIVVYLPLVLHKHCILSCNNWPPKWWMGVTANYCWYSWSMWCFRVSQRYNYQFLHIMWEL